MQLYQAEHAKVFRATWAFCGDRTVAEDATQEAFARALERWARLREQPWVTGWVTSTALNCIIGPIWRRQPLDGPEATESADYPLQQSAEERWWSGNLGVEALHDIVGEPTGLAHLECLSI